MIALRKDVKVGFTIGGIALGVFGVYLALSALAGPGPDTSMTGANLQLTPFGGSNTPTTVVDRTRTSPAASSTPRTPSTPVNTGPALANQPQQVRGAESSNADIWGNAFETGKLQPVVTVTPEAAKTPSGGAPKPAEVITAITQPPTENNAGASKTQTPTQTASADTSGSLLDLPQSSLTKSTPEVPAAAPAQSHTIQLGETFSSISAEYYGDAKYYKALVDANPQVDPNKLKPGIVIKVPPLAKREPRSDTVDVPSISKIDPTKQYVVKSGDSLSRIATTLYGDQNMWQAIYDLNKTTIGDSPARLKLGMVLNLPSPPTRN